MAKLPGAYDVFRKEFKSIANAYDQLGEVSAEWGPLNNKTVRLVKLGIAIGAGLEGAVHSHTRRALEAGVTAREIRHTVLLALTTLGFPAMMSASTWVEDVLKGKLHTRRRKKK